jgi:DNA-binding CsgD family transcriptional regulator
VTTVPSSRRGPSSRPVTPHQLKALQLASTGHTHKQIAGELGIEPASVGKLMTEIFRKLGARSMPHAVLLACQAGLLDGRPQRHGDHAGYAAHIYRGEEPCDACKAGEKTYRAQQRRKRQHKPAYDSGPSVREAAADDRRWWNSEKTGE